MSGVRVRLLRADLFTFRHCSLRETRFRRTFSKKKETIKNETVTEQVLKVLKVLKVLQVYSMRRGTTRGRSGRTGELTHGNVQGSVLRAGTVPRGLDRWMQC